ncbi:MAG: PLP-dependent aminotransferase family protein [Spirochaetales bacterium]|nr:PLP-dependent aminotransferase family protein [Spirochaetales bacterium]
MDYRDIKLKKGELPLYRQLARGIEEMILNDDISCGMKLPTIREMSGKFNLNNVTVINAYKLLEEKELIDKIPGSGSYVTYNNMAYRTELMDFTGRDSNIEAFPLKDIRESIESVLKDDGVEAFKYEDSNGFPGLQRALTHYFAFFNIDTPSEYIQIVSGGQQALDIISKALINLGDLVMTEAPTYGGAVNSFLSREGRVISIPLIKEGIDLVELESKIIARKPVFLYLMPFNQKPTGINYSLEQKKRLIALANEYNFYIVEDDLGSEIAPVGSASITLKSLDTEERVIYIKSFTSLFMPGLRLGCIIAPEKLYYKFLSIKQTTDISSPGLLQRGFTAYLEQKDWHSYFKTLALNLNEKINLTREILKESFSDLLEFDINTQAPYFWLKLKFSNGEALSRICRQKGVQIIPGVSSGEDYQRYFMLSVESIPLDNMGMGFNLLKESLRELYTENQNFTPDGE